MAQLGHPLISGPEKKLSGVEKVEKHLSTKKEGGENHPNRARVMDLPKHCSSASGCSVAFLGDGSRDSCGRGRCQSGSAQKIPAEGGAQWPQDSGFPGGSTDTALCS